MSKLLLSVCYLVQSSLENTLLYFEHVFLTSSILDFDSQASLTIKVYESKFVGGRMKIIMTLMLHIIL